MSGKGIASQEGEIGWNEQDGGRGDPLSTSSHRKKYLTVTHGQKCLWGSLVIQVRGFRTSRIQDWGRLLWGGRFVQQWYVHQPCFQLQIKSSPIPSVDSDVVWLVQCPATSPFHQGMWEGPGAGNKSANLEFKCDPWNIPTAWLQVYSTAVPEAVFPTRLRHLTEATTIGTPSNSTVELKPTVAPTLFHDLVPALFYHGSEAVMPAKALTQGPSRSHAENLAHSCPW